MDWWYFFFIPLFGFCCFIAGSYHGTNIAIRAIKKCFEVGKNLPD